MNPINTTFATRTGTTNNAANTSSDNATTRALEDIAFVLHLTRRVKDRIVSSRTPAAADHLAAAE